MTCVNCKIFFRPCDCKMVLFFTYGHFSKMKVLIMGPPRCGKSTLLHKLTRFPGINQHATFDDVLPPENVWQKNYDVFATCLGMYSENVHVALKYANQIYCCTESGFKIIDGQMLRELVDVDKIPKNMNLYKLYMNFLEMKDCGNDFDQEFMASFRV